MRTKLMILVSFIAPLLVLLPPVKAAAGPLEADPTLCGNGELDPAEECDDGNSYSGDGCNEACQAESGWECMVAGSPCTDIDECAVGFSMCEPYQTCVNTLGSYQCPCAAGAYWDNTVGLCQPCPQGTSNPLLGASECLPCAPGYYGPLKGAVTCKECPPGKYSDTVGAVLCTDCDAGYYAAGTANTACVACEEGHYAASSGLEECAACPAGTAAPSLATVVCTPCEPGYYTPSTGLSECIPCPAGRFSGQSGAQQCTLCPIGKYADVEGMASCQSCAPGSISDKPGTITCTPCAAGEYVAASGATACKACAAGTYSGSSGSATCSLCEAGYFAPFDGATYCLPCTEGQASPQGSSFCEWCQPGTYAPTAASPACLECAPGYEAPNQASTSCTQCKAGTFTASTGTVQCTKCPVGYYQPSLGQTSCTPCSVGSYASQKGQSTCFPCTAGTFASSQGTAICSSCEAGYYQSLAGQSHCFPCDPDTYTATSGAVSCTPCSSGFYANQGATDCYSLCGDGIMAGTEQCDDFNNNDGDCCSKACTLEPDNSPCGPDATECSYHGACNLSGACIVVPKQNGTPCTDSDLCDGLNKCMDGLCSPVGLPVTCPLPDACHNPGLCAPETGDCTYDPLPDTTICDPSGFGTQRCKQGVCLLLGDGTTCHKPLLLKLGDESQFSTASGYFTYAALPCAPANLAGPQLFFQVDLDEPGIYLVSVKPSPEFDPVLAFLSDCPSTSCSDYQDSNGNGLVEEGSYVVEAGSEPAVLRFMVGALDADMSGTFLVQVVRQPDTNPDDSPESPDDVVSPDVESDAADSAGDPDALDASPDANDDTDHELATKDQTATPDSASSDSSSKEVEPAADVPSSDSTSPVDSTADLGNPVSVADSSCHAGHGAPCAHVHSEIALAILASALLCFLRAARFLKRRLLLGQGERD